MGFDIMSFPLEQIGWGLRQLSLSGAVGNVFAIIIYLGIGAIPCGIFFWLRSKKKDCKVDYLLLLLSVMLLVVLYYMINPGLLAVSMLGSGKIFMGGTFYSVLVGYLVLRFILKKQTTDLESLQKSLRIVLVFVMILFAWSVVAECAVNLPAAIQSVREGNSVSDTFFFEAPDLTMTYVILVFQSAVNALPNGLCAVVIFFCIKTLDELLQNSESEKAVEMVKKITVFCKKSLVVVVVSGMMCNLAQILLSSQLYYMHISVNIPVFAIVFMLVIHIMARYIEENQKLKEDNSLFI